MPLRVAWICSAVEAAEAETTKCLPLPIPSLDAVLKFSSFAEQNAADCVGPLWFDVLVKFGG